MYSTFCHRRNGYGPIIAQAVVAVESDDTVESLAAKILEKEHEVYPYALKMIASGGL